MHICNDSASAHRTHQAFKFFIRGNSVTRATVTILAEDVDVAWNRLHALFPGSDLSDTEVQHGWHTTLSETAVRAQPSSATQ